MRGDHVVLLRRDLRRVDAGARLELPRLRDLPGHGWDVAQVRYWQWTSTRRLIDRPLSSRLSTSGRDSPAPAARSRAPGIPRRIRSVRTAAARRSESARL